MLPQNRLNGLDTLRALAIILVLIYHYLVVVNNERLFGFLSAIGWMGVDLFFVLSGYLIGNQILSPIAKQQHFSIRLFYIRRFLRTLPNYLVILAVYLSIPSLTGNHTAPLWEFLTFTQNLSMRPGETFTHSWSLCIEEQFYLFLPLVVLAVFRFTGSVKLFWGILISAMVFAAGLRGYQWNIHGGAAITWGDYWHNIYYHSFTRFDELLPGVAIAAVKNFHPSFFARLKTFGNIILAVGLFSLAILFYVMDHYFYMEGYGFSGVIASIGFTWIALTFAALTLAALSDQTPLARWRVPGAASVALWSYAVYLAHKPVFSLLKTPLVGWGFALNSYTAFAVVQVAGLLAGFVLYKLVETPFMVLRQKHFNSK